MLLRAGSIVFLASCVLTASTAAQTFTDLVNFIGSNGSGPSNALVQGPNGDLYGTTDSGGFCDTEGCGSIFEMTPGGTLTTLHNFMGADGAFPSGLTLASNGYFYGVTGYGGGGCPESFGCGTLFKMSPGGSVTTLYRFCSLANCTDGRLPIGTLVQATDGDLYGATLHGGTSGCGTVFRATLDGQVRTLATFTSVDLNGCHPASLIQAADGSFYGTAEGGANHAGVVFRVTLKGNLTTLYNFCSLANCTDGRDPSGGVIQATDGNFYGTTQFGGNECGGRGCGTIFQLTAGGALTTVHSFIYSDGYGPISGLIQATDGNLYGTTAQGGHSNPCFSNPCGNIFEISTGGTFTDLYEMTDVAGASPESPLFEATDGTFYGTTAFGGTEDKGVIFSLDTGLGPFVETVPAFGKTGRTVEILGTDLSGATNVTFNGTQSTFTVNSKGTAISTTVPAGATTGTVQVVTPSGTLSSNVPFRVL